MPPKGHADIGLSGLKDGHADGVNVVDTIEDFQGTECIEHHLRIGFGGNLHALAVLIVHNVHHTVCNDNAVGSTKPFLDPTGKVHPLFNQDYGVGTGLLCGFQKFQHIGGIPGGAIFHLFAVPGESFDWAFSLNTKCLLEPKLAECMCICTFGCIVAALVFVGFAQPCGGRAVEPSFRGRCRENSVYEMPKDELLEWAYTELTQKAQLAYEGQGEFRCGEWCRFCKAKAECRECAEANMTLARYDFRAPALLNDEEIADILGKVDALTNWAADVKEYALQQAVNGKNWPGWKLVEGRSNRKYTNEAAVAATVESAGFDPYDRKVLGVTAMQKLLGKSRFEELLTPYIEKPQGKPTLVPESDKRPAMNKAKNDFMEEF